MRPTVGLVGIVLLLSGATHPAPAGARRGTRRERILTVIRPGERQVRDPGERRRYPSPDGLYIARITHGDADTWSLAIIGRQGRTPLVHADDLQALVWVPGHPHRLVLATCSLYGKAILGQWDGGRGWRSLHRVRDPDRECFTLYGVTADGRSIVYGYDPAVSGRRTDGDPLRRRRWLRLPP